MSSRIAKAESDAQEIIERMRSVRSAGYDHAGELQGEAKRLVDWKEYVRAKPILSVAVASLFGFTIVRNAMQTVSKPSTAPLSFGGLPSDARSIRSTITSSLVTFATSVASTAIKNYFATITQRGNAEGDSNDRFRYASSKD